MSDFRSLSSFAILILAVLGGTLNADIVLEIDDKTVLPGETGMFDVTLSVMDKVDVLAWDTELVVEGSDPIIHLNGVVQTLGQPINDGMDNFFAFVESGALQASNVSSSSAVTLSSSDGEMVLYQVAYGISPTAAPGSASTIRFNPNFTNFIDSLADPIPVVASGGTFTVSPIPEPSAAAFIALAVSAIGIFSARSWLSRKSRVENEREGDQRKPI